MIKKFKIGILTIIVFILNCCLKICINNKLNNFIQSHQKDLSEKINSLKKGNNKNTTDDIYPLF